MTTLGVVLLAVGAALVGFAFVGYPALLWLMAGVRGRLHGYQAHATESDEDLPTVSITVPVHNEAHQISNLLASLVAIDYPRDRLQILIVSDGSTDGTEAIVREWESRGVELLVVSGRGGKGAAENAARSHLTGQVIVNTDASIRIQPGALRHLVRPFADPAVGVASGRDISVSGDSGDANSGEGGYVGYEMMVRDLETSTGGIVGASGCFYATRHPLHSVEVPAHLSRDFASALIARDHGFIAVSVPEATCLVPRTGSLRSEYRRKVRTVARGMTTLRAWGHLLNPLRDPLFAWKLFSHKVCRWALPLSLVFAVVGLALLAPEHPEALIVLMAGVFVMLLAIAGWVLGVLERPIPRVLAIPAFLAMSNVAVVHAFLRSIRGGSQQVWEPTRREGSHELPRTPSK